MGETIGGTAGLPPGVDQRLGFRTRSPRIPIGMWSSLLTPTRVSLLISFRLGTMTFELSKTTNSFDLSLTFDLFPPLLSYSHLYTMFLCHSSQSANVYLTSCLCVSPLYSQCLVSHKLPIAPCTPRPNVIYYDPCSSRNWFVNVLNPC